MSVDLAPRTTGLLPTWFVLLTATLWLTAILAAWRWRRPLARELIAIGALALTWLLFFWRPLTTPAQVPRGGGDLASFFFPLHAFAARTVQEGHVPFWNPTLFGGLPHWANYQVGILYPPNWFVWLLARPFSYGALELLVLIHYAIASLGAFALTRYGLGLGRIPSLAAGIVFPYSGFLVAHLGHYSMLAVAVWIPWLWLALTRLTATQRWHWVSGITVVTFLLATGGHQQTLLYSLLASGLWWLACVARWHHPQLRTFWEVVAGSTRADLLRALRPLIGEGLRAGLGITSGLLLAAPVLLPSFELARRSVRAGGLSYEQSSEFALQPLALLSFVLPRLWGDNPTNWWGDWSSGEVWAYAGIITLLLAGIGLVWSREPLRWALGGIGLLALLHAFGPNTPLHGWVYRFLPFADLLRAPARTLLFVDLTLALLAALGLAAIMETERKGIALLRGGLAVSIAALSFLITPLLLLPIVASATPPIRAIVALEGVLLAILWLSLVMVWLWTHQTRLPATVSAVAGIVLVTLDLFSATAPFNPTPDDLLSDFRHPSVVETVRSASRQGGPWRLLSLTIRWQPSAAAVHALEDAGGLYDPMQPAAYARVLECARSAPERPLLDLLNVRFLLTSGEGYQPGMRYSQMLTSAEGLVLWENPHALPRSWLATNSTITSLEAALARLCEADFDPRRELLLTGTLPPPDPTATGTTQMFWDGPNRLYVRVQTSAPAYLVVAVTADPGWHAQLDGKPVSIATADGIYQAVWVPSGQHTVVFTYRPPSLQWGLLAASVGGAMLLLALTLTTVTRRIPVVSRYARPPLSSQTKTFQV